MSSETSVAATLQALAQLNAIESGDMIQWIKPNGEVGSRSLVLEVLGSGIDSSAQLGAELWRRVNLLNDDGSVTPFDVAESSFNIGGDMDGQYHIALIKKES